MKKTKILGISAIAVLILTFFIFLVIYFQNVGDKKDNELEEKEQKFKSEILLKKIHEATSTENGIRGKLKNIQLYNVMQFPIVEKSNSEIIKIRKDKKLLKYGYDYDPNQSPLAQSRLILYLMIKYAKHRVTIVNMASPFVSLISDEFLQPIAAGLRDRKSPSKLKMLIVLGDMHTLVRLGAGIINPKLRMSYVLNKLPKGNHEIAFVLQNDMTFKNPLNFLLWNHSKFVIADGTKVLIGGMNFWFDYDDLNFYKKKGASEIAQTPIIDMNLSIGCDANELSKMAFLLAEKAMKYKGTFHKEINEQVKFKSLRPNVEEQKRWLQDYSSFEQILCKGKVAPSDSESMGFFVCKKYPNYFLKNYLMPDTVQSNPSRTAMYAAMEHCEREFCIDGQQILSEIDRFFTDIELKSREALKNVLGSAIIDFFPIIFSGIHSPRLMAYDRNNILRNIGKMLNRGVKVKILNSPHTNVSLTYSNDAPVKDLVSELIDLGASKEGLKNLEVKYVSFKKGHLACQHSKNWFADQSVCYVGTENSYSSTLHQSGVILSGPACIKIYKKVFDPKWKKGIVCNFNVVGTAKCDKIDIRA